MDSLYNDRENMHGIAKTNNWMTFKATAIWVRTKMFQQFHLIIDTDILFSSHEPIRLPSWPACHFD